VGCVCARLHGPFCLSLRSDYDFFFFSSRRRHTRLVSDWSSDMCSSDLPVALAGLDNRVHATGRLLISGPPSGASLLPLPASSTRSEERRVGKEWRSRRARDD